MKKGPKYNKTHVRTFWRWGVVSWYRIVLASHQNTSITKLLPWNLDRNEKGFQKLRMSDVILRPLARLASLEDRKNCVTWWRLKVGNIDMQGYQQSKKKWKKSFPQLIFRYLLRVQRELRRSKQRWKDHGHSRIHRNKSWPKDNVNDDRKLTWNSECLWKYHTATCHAV